MTRPSPSGNVMPAWGRNLVSYPGLTPNPLMVWFIIAWPQSKPHWKGYLISLAGLTAPYAPLIWWQWELLTASTQLTAMSFTPLPKLLGSTLLYQTYGILSPGEPIWRVPLIALGMAGLLLGFQVIRCGIIQSRSLYQFLCK